MITAIDFIGQFVVAVEIKPGRPTNATGYRPTSWPGWTVDVKGAAVTFTGPTGQSVEVPRHVCVIYRKPDPKPEPKEE